MLTEYLAGNYLFYLIENGNRNENECKSIYVLDWFIDI
jgi:hypothetical protein